MGEFFRGWRRKLGCVTLMLALVFTVAWARSEVKYDFVSLHLRRATYKIGSLAGTVRLIQETAPMQREFHMGSPLLHWSSGDTSKLLGLKTDEHGRRRVDWDDGYDVKWRWEWNGFAFGVATRGKFRFEASNVPYWSIVIPLTLISAWLLLSKPTSKTVTDLNTSEDR